MVDYHIKVDEVFTNENIYKFCDGRNYFLNIPIFLHESVKQ